MDSTEFKEGRMYSPDNQTYSDTMKPVTEMARKFEDTIMLYAEEACRLFKDDKTITIADYCTADGLTVISILKKLLGQIRCSNTKAEITVVFEDQEGNDYNALFRNVLKENSLPNDHVYIMASSTTMYKQCLPTSSASFIFSFNGLYYLSNRPCLMRNSMFPMQSDPDEFKLFQKQAEIDWRLFLLQRSKELKPGGLLFLIPSVLDCHVQFIIYSQLNSVLKSLLDDGIISQSEYVNIGYNSFIRTEEELRKPFIEKTEEVRNLELVSFDVSKETIFETGNELIGEQRAAEIADMIKTWAYKAIIDHLDEERQEEAKGTIVTECFRRFTDKYKDLTEDFYYLFPRLVIRKRLV